MASLSANSEGCFRAEEIGKAVIRKCKPECGCSGLWGVDFRYSSKFRSHMCLESWEACMRSAKKSIEGIIGG